jgi:hypothetical protein
MATGALSPTLSARGRETRRHHAGSRLQGKNLASPSRRGGDGAQGRLSRRTAPDSFAGVRFCAGTTSTFSSYLAGLAGPSGSLLSREQLGGSSERPHRKNLRLRQRLPHAANHSRHKKRREATRHKLSLFLVPRISFTTLLRARKRARLCTNRPTLCCDTTPRKCACVTITCCSAPSFTGGNGTAPLHVERLLCLQRMCNKFRSLTLRKPGCCSHCQLSRQAHPPVKHCM